MALRDIDSGAAFNDFNTALLGRRTFESMARAGHMMPGMKTFVFSRTPPQRDHRDVTIVAENSTGMLSTLKASPGEDIWLFGGGSLFRSLAAARLVDTVEVAVIPILLGEGIPLLPSPANPKKLTLPAHKAYKTGIVSLEYAMT